MNSPFADPPRPHTKIVCTLGPATDKPGVLENLLRSGMDVARINMSHGTRADHEARVARVRAASEALRRPVAILADLPGPKFRLGQISGGARSLEDGMTVFLAVEARSTECLPVRHRKLLNALRTGESIHLADGSVELRVKAVASDRVACEVVVGGTVRSGSGINVPESELLGLVPTETDRRQLAFAVSRQVEWIGVSFVQSPDDLQKVRACISGSHRPLLMAKIEKRSALANLDAIVEAADGVMVARGDLGVETDLAEIPLAQKRIIATANAKARPVVTATQMLESMVEHERPTRAEMTDVANAVLDGTDAVMLSAESAVGRHPVAAVSVLQRVLVATEAAYAMRLAVAGLRTPETVTADQALPFAACQLVQRLGAKAIIAHVSDHTMSCAIARFRPAVPIVALSPSPALCRSLTMISGVIPLLVSADESTGMVFAHDWLVGLGLASAGDRVAVLSATNDTTNATDTLRVLTLPY